MASSAVITVSEYLSTSYQPDCDYVDGKVQERLWGEYDHASLRGAIVFAIAERRRDWKIRVLPSLRVQINSSRFRVPDVCVISASAPREQIIQYPPLLCIEVLSPEDTVLRMKDRIQDFISMGVAQVWIFDPRTRTAMVCDGSKMVDVTGGSITLPGTPITLNLAEVFSALDEA